MNIVAASVAVLMLSQVMQGTGQSIIRGRVLDADGQPMPNVDMTVMLATEERQKFGPSVLTDGDGKFLLEKVPAGRVLLRAQPRLRPPAIEGGVVKRDRFRPPAYFPGVLELLDAWPIDVAAGEIIELDFHMPVVVVGSIKTTVSGPDGYTIEQLRAMRPEGNEIKNVTVDADGIGYAEGLREGRYVVAARGRTKDQRLAAFQIVHITAGEHPVELTLAPAATITGRVVSDRGGIPPIGNMRVVAAWTDGSIDLDPLSRDEAEVGLDGSFVIPGLFGTRAIRVTGLPKGWEVSSIRAGRADVTTSGIGLAAGEAMEITITLSRR
jgi:Carboxypeptidase regulatory-like domain